MSYYSTKKKAKRWFWTILILLAVGTFCVWKYIGFDKVRDTYEKIRPARTDTVAQDTATQTATDTVFIERKFWRDSIQLQGDGRHQYTDITIDGVKIRKALFDTGCTDGLSSNLITYRFLLANGNIRKKGNATATIANGDTVETVMAVAYNVEVFNLRLDSLECSFIMTENAPTLVGKGAIDKLGDYSINPKSNKLYTR
jgi:hypothetical protein